MFLKTMYTYSVLDIAFFKVSRKQQRQKNFFPMNCFRTCDEDIAAEIQQSYSRSYCIFPARDSFDKYGLLFMYHTPAVPTMKVIT